MVWRKKPKKKDGGDEEPSKPLAFVKDSCGVAFQIGCLDFWSNTPFEFSLKLSAFNKGKQAEQQIQSWHTWHIAALSRCSKMPKLSEFVDPITDEAKTAANERKLEAMLMARVKKSDGKHS